MRSLFNYRYRRYSLSSSICGAARHASLDSSIVNVTIVNVTSAFFYCRSLQNQVQTTGSAAPSLIAPGFAFIFPAIEAPATAAAVNVTAMFTSGTVFEAACQQTYSTLFRGLAPPIGLTITVRCPQCTAQC